MHGVQESINEKSDASLFKKFSEMVIESSQIHDGPILVMHSDLKITEQAVNEISEGHNGVVGAYPNAGYWIKPHWQFVDEISPDFYLSEAKSWVSSGAQINLANTTDLETGMTLIMNNKSTGNYITTVNAGNVIMFENVEASVTANQEVIFQKITYPTYPNPYTTSNIVLFGDNINKVPRDLNKVGPTDRIYASDVRLFNRVNTLYTACLLYTSPSPRD